jgi:hypothetical protein
MSNKTFNVNALNLRDQQAYFQATKRLEISQAIHHGALALVAAPEGYALSHTSKAIEIEGIKRLVELGNAKSAIYEGAVRYFITY